MSRASETVVGRLVRRPERPERFALVHADGRLSNWFGIDETRLQIRDVLRRNGLELRDDGSVVRAE
jgi:hypothetical protein